MNFYLYSYAVCISIASYVASRILNNDKGMLEKYMNFLTLGGDKWPDEAFSVLGIDLTDEKVLSTVSSALSTIGDENNRIMRGIFLNNDRQGPFPRLSMKFFDSIQQNISKKITDTELENQFIDFRLITTSKEKPRFFLTGQQSDARPCRAFFFSARSGQARRRTLAQQRAYAGHQVIETGVVHPQLA